jgi:hypothetical protein
VRALPREVCNYLPGAQIKAPAGTGARRWHSGCWELRSARPVRIINAAGGILFLRRAMRPNECPALSRLFWSRHSRLDAADDGLAVSGKGKSPAMAGLGRAGQMRCRTRATCTGDHLPDPAAVGMRRSFKPSAMAWSVFAPDACISAIRGAISAARSAARRALASGPGRRDFGAIGITTCRLGP